jgi:acetyltransferase-like isoleucine patch superfamily enzyme
MINRIARSISYRARQAQSFTTAEIARLKGAEIGSGAKIGRCIDINFGFLNGRIGEIKIGNNVEIENFVTLNAYGGHIVLGNDIFVGQGVVMYGHGGVYIDAYALISMHCKILSSNHTVPDVGTHIRSMPDILLPTRIGRDVWLGAGVTVLGGVTIGDGAVVGAGAVVASDLPKGAVALGIPARIVRHRSSDQRDSVVRERKN